MRYSVESIINDLTIIFVNLIKHRKLVSPTALFNSCQPQVPPWAQPSLVVAILLESRLLEAQVHTLV